MPQRLNPDCPSQTHQSVAAIRRKPSCICPGPHHEAFVKFRQQENAKRAAYRSKHGVPEPIDSVVAPDFYSPDVPEPEEFSVIAKYVHKRHDMACAEPGRDPELWFPVGDSGIAAAQIREAKRVCLRECPLLDDCATAVLGRNEEFGVWAGMTPAERRRVRAQMAGWAA